MKNTLGNRITKARKAHKWTQIELAKKLKVNTKNVMRWEKDENLPNIEMAVKIASVLGISLNALATGETEKDDVSAVIVAKLNALKPQQREAVRVIVEGLR